MSTTGLFFVFMMFFAVPPTGIGADNSLYLNDHAMEELNDIQKVKSYGEKITYEGVIEMSALLEEMKGKESFECKVRGEITSTCVKKGCWMTIKSPEGEAMRVTFKDYGFFVPTSDQEGKKAIMRGTAKVETTTVEMLRHYAEDAGKSKEEIEKITEPETSLAFEADGVLIEE